MLGTMRCGREMVLNRRKASATVVLLRAVPAQESMEGNSL